MPESLGKFKSAYATWLSIANRRRWYYTRIRGKTPTSLSQDQLKEVTNLKSFAGLSYNQHLTTMVTVGFVYKLVRKSTYWVSSVLRHVILGWPKSLFKFSVTWKTPKELFHYFQYLLCLVNWPIVWQYSGKIVCCLCKYLFSTTFSGPGPEWRK